MSLTGKRVMVVGGSSGIGLAAARRLAGMGARVIVVGRAEDKLARARTLARELAPIRVNVLSPGFVDTPAYDAMPADAANLYRRMAEAAPIGRIGAADELADAVVFLLGNGFTTGAVLDVDGGRRLA